MMIWRWEDISKVVSGWRWDRTCRDRQFLPSDKSLEEKDVSSGQMPWPFCRLNLRLDPVDTTKTKALPAFSLSATRLSVLSGDEGKGMTRRIFLLPNLSSSHTSPPYALLCSQHRGLAASLLGHRILWLGTRDPGWMTAARSTASSLRGPSLSVSACDLMCLRDPQMGGVWPGGDAGFTPPCPTAHVLQSTASDCSHRTLQKGNAGHSLP